MRIRRTVFAGLGVLAFLVAVILTLMSADESRWSNFGISVGLSIGLAVFMWFITDGLRADIKQVLGNQDELANHVDELMKTIGKGTEGTEDQDPLVRRVNTIAGLLNGIIAQLGRLSGETLGILDGVLTALDVEIDDGTQKRPIQIPTRWKIAKGSTSMRTAFAAGPNSFKRVRQQQDDIHVSVKAILKMVNALEKKELNINSSLNAISEKQKKELHHSLDQLRESIEELKTQLKDEEAIINDDSAGDQLQSKDQT